MKSQSNPRRQNLTGYYCSSQCILDWSNRKGGSLPLRRVLADDEPTQYEVVKFVKKLITGTYIFLDIALGILASLGARLWNQSSDSSNGRPRS
jgi:hypothetical protein